jgi:hypothetical protein
MELSERTQLVLELIDDDLDHTMDHVERQRVELRVWTLAHGEWPAPLHETREMLRKRMRNMWISVVNIDALHYWARIFLRLHEEPVHVLADDCLALAMCCHERLGSSSMLGSLPPDVLNVVVGVLRVQVEAETQAAIEASYALRMYYIYVNNRSPENVLLYFSLHAKDRAYLSRASVDFLEEVSLAPVVVSSKRITAIRSPCTNPNVYNGIQVCPNSTGRTRSSGLLRKEPPWRCWRW